MAWNFPSDNAPLTPPLRASRPYCSRGRRHCRKSRRAITQQPSQQHPSTSRDAVRGCHGLPERRGEELRQQTFSLFCNAPFQTTSKCMCETFPCLTGNALFWLMIMWPLVTMLVSMDPHQLWWYWIKVSFKNGVYLFRSNIAHRFGQPVLVLLQWDFDYVGFFLPQVTALKIRYNPFAKAFLDAKERPGLDPRRTDLFYNHPQCKDKLIFRINRNNYFHTM